MEAILAKIAYIRILSNVRFMHNLFYSGFGLDRFHCI